MAKNERKRQKQLAAKKKKRNQKKAKSSGTLSTFQFNLKSAEQADSYPIRDCFVPEDMFLKGIGTVILTRDLPSGEIVMGGYLVDTYCLGIKNAFLKASNVFDYREFIEEISYSEDLERADPSFARKLVEDGLAYAQGLGFRPHKDYKKARLLFGSIDSSNCDSNFEFGKDGKPFYISGPFDSPQKIERIRRSLTKSCGEDGFELMILSKDDALGY